MKKAYNVTKFYVLTNCLKNLIRTGWKDWNVRAERIESVAEHVYGVQMLALAMYSEYQYDIDLAKVMYMLAIHELEEVIIGDLTFRQVSVEDKTRMGHEAIEKILGGLLNGNEIKKIIWEFDEGKTREAKFAYHCDKLECDLQCKLYDEAGYVDPHDQKENIEHSPEVMAKIMSGELTWSYCWMSNDRKKFVDDDSFMEVLDYAIDNKISLDMDNKE